ncbi:hypothetical protein [Thiomicrorhabdus sediminis]|uniref:Uncharacterized protein n=1 Tax=Thiomicrorhabdus sediminis TaxID=2580412 RepID=A0A4P9K4D9_9GAMM|nr:hypothetical protein [Thiomicrorhabdus sediminis]QCU89799.1 hypothetical protein FE785_03675 [Thiomicrorhabdus sediminis]
MRYFKDGRNRKVFAISPDQEYLIHLDWIEISAEAYEQVLLEVQQAELEVTHSGIEPNQARVDQIMERLIEIDVESIRPLRAIATHTDVLLDHQRLKRLNEERQALILELGNKRNL